MLERRCFRVSVLEIAERAFRKGLRIAETITVAVHVNDVSVVVQANRQGRVVSRHGQTGRIGLTVVETSERTGTA